MSVSTNLRVRILGVHDDPEAAFPAEKLPEYVAPRCGQASDLWRNIALPEGYGALLLDLSPEIVPVNEDYMFFEFVFGFPPQSLKCTIRNCGYGLCIGGSSLLSPLIEKLLAENIPAVANVELPGSAKKQKAVLVNGLDSAALSECALPGRT